MKTGRFALMVLTGLAFCVLSSCSDSSSHKTVPNGTRWSENGVPICTGGGWATKDVKAIYNGFGETIIAWSDLRAAQGNFDIYVQALDYDGNTQWQDNGSPMCTAPGEQIDICMIADSIYGGANMAWVDGRSGTDADIYAQQVGISGDQAWWPENGVPVCTASRNQVSPQITTNGEGGSIIVWEDQRPGQPGVYAQSINHFGFTQWTDNGIPICNASSRNPQIVTDGNGGAIITWEDYRSGVSDIYVQHIDSNGKAMWGENGIPICTALNRQENPQIVTSGTGGTLITWEDSRSGEAKIYVQSVGPEGLAQWDDNGIPVCKTPGDQRAPVMVFTGQYFYPAIICWEDRRSGLDWDIYAQRIDLEGGLMWDENGVAVCTSDGNQKSPQIAIDKASRDIIVTWEDLPFDPSSFTLYAQKVASNGSIVWAKNGVPVSSIDSALYEHSIAPDGSGGAVIAWSDTDIDANTGLAGLYAQAY